MHKPTFEEFKRRYLSAESGLTDLLLNQLRACEPCGAADYQYCLTKCSILKRTLAEARRFSDFFWIAKRTVYQILQFVKAETYCRANGIEVDYVKELSIPDIERIPPEDKPVIEELHKLFAEECKTCRLAVGESCFECEKAKALRKKLKTASGERVFIFFLTTYAGVTRMFQEKEKEILFFYERIYAPPVKVEWLPKDPWGVFFWKVLDRKRH